MFLHDGINWNVSFLYEKIWFHSHSTSVLRTVNATSNTPWLKLVHFIALCLQILRLMAILRRAFY